MWIWGTNGWKEGRGKRLLTGAGRLSRYFYPKCFLPHFLVWAASRQRQSVLRQKNGMRNISTPDTLDFTLNFFLGVNHTSEDKILDTLLLLMLPLGFYLVFFKIKCRLVCQDRYSIYYYYYYQWLLIWSPILLQGVTRSLWIFAVTVRTKRSSTRMISGHSNNDKSGSSPFWMFQTK